jgi:hypothetical protein
MLNSKIEFDYWAKASVPAVGEGFHLTVGWAFSLCGWKRPSKCSWGGCGWRLSSESGFRFQSGWVWSRPSKFCVTLQWGCARRRSYKNGLRL